MNDRVNAFHVAMDYIACPSAPRVRRANADQFKGMTDEQLSRWMDELLRERTKSGHIPLRARKLYDKIFAEMQRRERL